MDPLSPLGRNEVCWCRSGLKYKFCHGNKRPASMPGAPLPEDPPNARQISPTLSVAKDAFTGSLQGEVPLTLPEPNPTPLRIQYTNWEHDLPAALVDPAPPMDAASLGRLRVEVLRRISGVRASHDPPGDTTLEALYRLAGETIKTVDALSRTEPRPTILWNEELDVATFMGRTLLLADHVLVPDGLFAGLMRSTDMSSLKRLATEQLEFADLYESGLAIPVPDGVAMAHQGPTAQMLTARDLENPRLVEWVRDQLIFEGPTAVEVLLVHAADDLSYQPANFWMHGRLDADSLDAETGYFRTGMLLPYEPDFDYGPWKAQVNDQATAYYVQRTHQRVVAADVFAAEYVSASMFEARLLQRRGTNAPSAAQSAVWADIPSLTSLNSPDLAKVLQNENAVADLRDQVRTSLQGARTQGDQAERLTHLAHELEAASHKLEKRMSSDRFWQAITPAGFGTAGLVIGAFAGGIPALAAGGLSALAGLTPYLGSRLANRREAAYLFVTARKRQDRT